jgi:hypothetical protein
MVQMVGSLAVIVVLLAAGAWAAGGSGYRGPFGFGRVPSEAEIKTRDIAVGTWGAPHAATARRAAKGKRQQHLLLTLLCS